MVERPVIGMVRHFAILRDLIVTIVDAIVGVIGIIDVVDRIVLVDDVTVIVGNGAVVAVDVSDVIRRIAVDHGGRTRDVGLVVVDHGGSMPTTTTTALIAAAATTPVHAPRMPITAIAVVIVHRADEDGCTKSHCADGYQVSTAIRRTLIGVARVITDIATVHRLRIVTGYIHGIGLCRLDLDDLLRSGDYRRARINRLASIVLGVRGIIRRGCLDHSGFHTLLLRAAQVAMGRRALTHYLDRVEYVGGVIDVSLAQCGSPLDILCHLIQRRWKRREPFHARIPRLWIDRCLQQRALQVGALHQ